MIKEPLLWVLDASGTVNATTFWRSDYGLIRVYELESGTWFIASDPARFLGFDRVSQIRRRLDPSDLIFMDNSKGALDSMLIYEDGLRTLADCSSESAAKRYLEWVSKVMVARFDDEEEDLAPIKTPERPPMTYSAAVIAAGLKRMARGFMNSKNQLAANVDHAEREIELAKVRMEEAVEQLKQHVSEGVETGDPKDGLDLDTFALSLNPDWGSKELKTFLRKLSFLDVNDQPSDDAKNLFRRVYSLRNVRSGAEHIWKSELLLTFKGRTKVTEKYHALEVIEGKRLQAASARKAAGESKK